MSVMEREGTVLMGRLTASEDGRVLVEVDRIDLARVAAEPLDHRARRDIPQEDGLVSA